jgi:transcriptional regulator
MTLYNPPHFAHDERAAMLRVIGEHPFATLITPTAGEPFVSHVPLLHEADGSEHGALVGHFARANPHHEAAGAVESIAVFHGPHAYVSPSWYGEPDKMVPTWNYVVVHAHGRIIPYADTADLLRVLASLTSRFEGPRDAPWRFAMAEPQRSAMLRAIVGFRMPIRRMVGKFKLSQNRSAADRARVVAGLRGEPWPESAATAQWMERGT